MYCPYCGAHTWTDDLGEVHCPGGGLFSKRSLIALNPHPKVESEKAPGLDLAAFWITTQAPQDPVGFGVTARSLADALEILERFGYVIPDRRGLSVIANVRHHDLDPYHVIPNSGPTVARGLWYPLVQLGL